MRFQAAVLLLTLPLPIAGMLGCSAADPGVITFGPHHDAGAQQVASKDAGSAADSAVPVSDAGASVDAGTDAAVAINAFTGAAAFASAPVATSAEQEHTTRNVGTVPTGQACLSCHTGAGATKFSFAGTIYKDALGTAGAPDVELRIVNAQGLEKGTVHSDANGNFWLVDDALVTAGSWTGTRNATTKTLMVEPIANGSCNTANCHDSKMRLHIP